MKGDSGTGQNSAKLQRLVRKEGNIGFSQICRIVTMTNKYYTFQNCEIF